MLSMVFVGLPELLDRLRLGIHRSMLTRIHCKVEFFDRFPRADLGVRTKASHRRRRAGGVFTADGLAMLHELTGGVLRSIDVLGLASLRLAADEDQRLVDRNLVRRALQHTPLA